MKKSTIATGICCHQKTHSLLRSWLALFLWAISFLILSYPSLAVAATTNLLGGAIQGADLNLTMSNALVSTFAGSAGVSGSADGVGADARFNLPSAITTDGANLYVADTYNYTIRKIAIATGTITTMAGVAGAEGSADGVGSIARFYRPLGITTDGVNLYVADTYNHTIRKIVIATGMVTTIAGVAGVEGSSDGTGATARFNLPYGLTTDGANLYVPDLSNHTIRKIVIATGTVTTIAGAAGAPGSSDGVGVDARFNTPSQITTDGANLYVADLVNHTIRKIVIATGVVTTLAGSANVSGLTDGTGSIARFSLPYGITTDGANLYVSEAGNVNETIRKIVIATGAVTTVAGSAGEPGSADGSGSVARFRNPEGMTTDGVNLYVTDQQSHTIRKIKNITSPYPNLLGGAVLGRDLDLTISNVFVTTLAGTAGVAGSADGTGSETRFSYPADMTTDGANLYVADYYNNTIRKISIATGTVTTLAGSAGTVGSANGIGPAARFNAPFGITTDGVNLFVVDCYNHTVRKIVIATGAVTTLAGAAGVLGSTDGAGAAARFNYPEGITTDGANLYVADTYNHAIRKIVIATGQVTTPAGTAGVTGSADGAGATARFYYPGETATDGVNVYVTDTGNNVVRKIVIATGTVTTLAGTAGVVGSADGLGSAAGFYAPHGITTDGVNLYIADHYNDTIRKIVIATGAVTTLAGSAGASGSADGSGTTARFYHPIGITTDGVNLYVADTYNNTIRKIANTFVPAVASSAVLTNNPQPTWTWSSGGSGGTGTYRYKLDNSDLTTGATETTATSYTPAANLSEGSHTLYVQERDGDGNWSLAGSFAVTVTGAGLWTTKAPMAAARHSAAGGAINGIFYVAGGTAGTFTDTLQAYDPATDTWRTLASMPAGRTGGNGAGVIDGKLYVPGGWSSYLPNSELYVYDPATDTWTTKASMLSLSACGATGVINGKLYVTTACDGYYGYRNTLQVYDPATNGWNFLASSPTAHAYPAWGVIDNKFYVAGGGDDAGVVQAVLHVYDPVANTWTTKAPMPVAGAGFVSGVINGKLYVTGGHNGAGLYFDSVYVYDPVTDAWTTDAVMPTPRLAATAAVVNGVLYVAGGADSAGLILSTVEAFTPGWSRQAAYGRFRLPDTGQTGNYTGTWGEDSDYSLNPPSYLDNGNGTVTDKVTGLLWQKQDDAATRVWADAVNYCTGLTLAGYTDWRLPTRLELASIVNYGVSWPAIDSNFPATSSGGYWTSTVYAYDASAAWVALFNNGQVGAAYKTTPEYARCVRGEQALSSFTDTGNGTIVDNVTDLMWQKQDDNVTRYPDAAMSYCEDLSLGGYTDWRLPNVRELGSLADHRRYSLAIDTAFFPGTMNYYYWASTHSTYGGYAGWMMVGFQEGAVTWSDQITTTGYVRCVRGESGTRSTLTLTVTKSGTGSGAVSVDTGTLDWSGSTGTATYTSGTSVTLTANVDAGSAFTGWSGACTGTGTCTVIMDGAKNVTATFSDTTPPNAPTVTAGSPLTNNNRPTWTWSSGGNGGNGTYRYKLDNSDLTTGATETVTASYTPGVALAEGVHTLYVQERDVAGNWSASGSFAVTVDTVAPTSTLTNVPTSIANSTMANFSFTSETAATFLCQLDGGAWTTCTSPLNYSDLTQGAHTLLIKASDGAGNTETPVSYSWTVDTVAPNAPVVSGTALTNNTKPTWTWAPGGNGGNGTYRFELNISNLTGAVETSATSFAPAAALPEGSHTLYVQERDAAGNWSANGSFAVMLDITPPSAGTGGLIQLPKTGQTKCYDASGEVISCNGTGQDGEIQAGVTWPIPRFNDNGDGTMMDNLTDLMWIKDMNLIHTRDPITYRDGTASWQFALDFIKTLNQENYLGHNDWRLPNINELASVANVGQANPATWLNLQGFTNAQGVTYWSSTSLAISSSRALVVYMWNNGIGSGEKGNNYSVWPVRTIQSESAYPFISIPATGQTNCYNTSGTEIGCAGTGQDGEMRAGVAWPNPLFTDNGDQTVTNKLTGLVWLKDAYGSGQATCGLGGAKNWQQTLDYIECLNVNNYLGHSDWRLPNVNELKSLVNYGQSNPADWLNVQGVTNVQTGLYWSSSSGTDNADGAWIVRMWNGDVGSSYPKSNSYYAWPVRGALSGTGIAINSSSTASKSTLVTLDLNATDERGVAEMMIGNDSSFSGAAEEAYATTRAWNLSTGDGTKTVYVKFKDNAGNWSQVYSTTIVLDTVVPVTTINNKPTAATNSTSAIFAFSSESGATFQCQLDNGNWVVCTSPVNYASLTPGSHTFSIRATDAAGNSETVPVTYTWTVDTTGPDAPTVSGTTPTNNQKPTWTWSTGGNGGSGSYRYKLDNSDLTTGATETTATSYTPVANLSEGAHTLYVQERDAAGNWSNAGSFAITVDVTVPTFGGLTVLPKTGQTTCYDTAGVAASCAGSGQDGEIQAGVAWPNPRFANPDGTAPVSGYIVLDRLTGLEWPKDAGTPTTGACTGGTKTWQQALDYVACLNTNNYLGHSDWRLPNIREIDSLVDAASSNPALPAGHPFANVVLSNWYWSSTTSATTVTADKIFYIRFSDGATTVYQRASYYVWPVRSSQSPGTVQIPKTGQTTKYATGDDGDLQAGAAWPAPRFKDNNNGTVTDKLTGLIWLKEANCIGAMTWTSALSSTDALAGGQCSLSDGSLAGDWRLPNRKELMSLVDVSKTVPALGGGFTNVQASGLYWSSSNVAGNPGSAWAVEMYHQGYANVVAKPGSLPAWPVRGGLSGGSAISINSGADYTKSVSITLALSAADANGVTEMMLSNDASFNNVAPEPYVATRVWTLPVGDGDKTVYIKFKDGAGNWSPVHSASIRLDTTGPTVTAMPPGGTYLTSRSVSLTCGDASGSGCGSIYYTTDGTVPSTSSTAYSGAIDISSTTTLKFIALDALGNPGPVQSEVYTIQGVTMLAGHIDVVKGETRQTNVLLTSIGGFDAAMNLSYAWQGNVPASVTVSIEPPSLVPAPSGAAATVSVTAGSVTAAGNYTLQVTATGGSYIATADVPVTVANPFTLDTAATLSGTKGEALAPITTAGGIGTATFSILSGTPPPGVTFNVDGTFSGLPTARGTYTFTIRVTDTDGHTLNRDYTLRIYDPAFRQLVLTAPSWSVEKGAVLGSIIAKVIDDYGVDANVSANTLITISSTSSTGKFSVDYGFNFSPSNIFSPMIYEGYNLAEFQYKDTVAGTFTIRANGKAGSPSQNWALGEHDITVIDPAPGIVLTVTKAGTGTGKVTSNPAGIDCGGDCQETYTNSPTIVLTAVPDAGSAFAGWSGACIGPVTCTLLMDVAKNVTATFSDAIRPVVSAGGDKTKNAVFTQTATAIDANSMTYAWSAASGPGTINFGSPAALSTTISASMDGAYVIRFTATDTAGNSASGDMTLTWDTTAPDTSLTGQPANPTNSTSATFSFAANDAGATFQCQLDGGGYASCTSPKSYPGLAEGSHTFSVKVTDAAGNVDPTPATYTWVVDITPPGAPAVSGVTPVNNNQPTWTWASGGNGGNGTYRYKLDNSDLTSGAAEAAATVYTPATALSEGLHTLYVQERDAAGNWSSAGSAGILVDMIVPVGLGAGIAVDAEAAATKTTAVSLSLAAFDANGVTRMMISKDSSFNGAAAEQYAASRAWTLTSGDGVKTVYVKFGDGAGNWSGVYSDTIILDTTGPTVTAVPPAGKYIAEQSITLTCSDASGSGCGNIYYSTDGSEPTRNSSRFSGTINISWSTTLKFFAVDLLDNSGPLQTAVYDIQGVALSAGNINVAKGETKQTVITLTALGGFNAPMNLSYAWQGNTPANATVSIAPAALTPTPAGAVATVTVAVGISAAAGNYNLIVTAAGGDITKAATIPVQVVEPATISTPTLPGGVKGGAYAAAIAVTGGVAPYTFTKVAGALPDGLTLNADGTFSGTPTVRGTFIFTVQVADSDGHTLTKEYSLRVYDPAYRKLVLETTSWEMLKNLTTGYAVSGWIYAKVLDDYDASVNVTSTATLDLSSTSPTGNFSLDGANWSDNMLSANIASGSSWSRFRYRDTSPGSHTIAAAGVPDTASANWQAASQAITVTLPDLSTATLNVSVTQNAVYGQGVIVSGDLKDVQAGTLLTQKTIYLVFTSPSGGKTPVYTTQTGSDGKYAYTAGMSVIDAAGSWSVQATFKDGNPIAYNDATATANFSITKADTRLVMLVDTKSISPTGTVTISGQLYSNTAVPVDLAGITIIIDLIEPNGAKVYSYTTATTDSLGHFSYTYTGQFGTIGSWNIRVRLAGTGNLNGVDSESQKVIVARSAGYAILIQGDYGGKDRNIYGASLDDIYKKLIKRSFETEDIYYLSYAATTHDPGIPTSGFTTKEKVRDAIKSQSEQIKSWAETRITAGGVAPLYIILIDHGSPGLFHVDQETVVPADQETITPDDLNEWVAALETNIQNNLHQPLPVIIVNGTCYSGSFIPKLSKAGRVIITSGAADEQTAQGPFTSGKTYGEYFVYYLFDYLAAGENLRDAFKDAAQLTHQYRECKGQVCGKNALNLNNGDDYRQHPLLDDNGDGEGSWMNVVGQEDGTLTAGLVLGLGTNPVTVKITEVMPTTTVLQGSTSVLAYLKTSDPAKTIASWIEVKNPSFVFPDSGGTGQVVMDLPKYTGTYNETALRWEYTIPPLDEAGAYTIYYYAAYYNVVDNESGVLPPVKGTLYVDTAANRAPAAFNLTGPADNAELNDAMMIFRWEKAADPDLDPVTYTLKIYDEETGSEIKRYELISREFFFMNATLEKQDDGITPLFTTGKYYSWKVEAVDSKGRSVEAPARRFRVIFTNAQTGIITGIVFSDIDYSKIATATIIATIGGVTTSIPVTDGSFALAASPGAVDMLGTAGGYQNVVKEDVVVRAGAVSTVSIAMTPTTNSSKLTVSKQGAGTVTSASFTINCGDVCEAIFNSGDMVTLTAAPASGYTFINWSGACSGAAASCAVTMDAAKTVTATFADVTLPTGSITVNGGAIFTKDAVVSLALSAIDTAGAVQMQFSNDNGTWSAAESFAEAKPWTLSSGDGMKTVYVRFRDGAGNLSQAYSDTVTLDGTAPAVTLGALPAFTNNPALIIGGTASDATSGMQSLQVNGQGATIGAGQAFSHPVTLVPGNNTIIVTATDKAGNVTTESRTVVLDQTSPVVSVNVPTGNNTTNMVGLTITGTSDEAATVTIALNGGSAQAAMMNGNAFSLPLTLAYGPNTIDITITDRAGNTSTMQRQVVYDNQNPSLAVTVPGQDVITNQGSFVLKGTVADLTAITMAVTEGANTYHPAVATGGAFEQALTLTMEKTYEITVTATDEAGNTVTARRNITYDRTPPAFTLNPPETPTYRTTQTLTGTREKGAEVTVACLTAFVGAVTYPTETSWSVTLSGFSAETNSLTLKARDSAGNETTINDAIMLTAVPGDINNDKKVDLLDAILALKIMSRIDLPPEVTIRKENSLNPNGMIGLGDVLYIMQHEAGLRP